MPILRFFRLTCALFIISLGIVFCPLGYAQERSCVQAAHASTENIHNQAAASQKFRRAHRHATGAGIRVAIIDTGVSPHPRLGPVEDAGSFINDGMRRTGLYDCDAHGTTVAGIIATRDGPDGVIGIAPAATIISIKQMSARHNYSPGAAPTASGNLSTLAQSIHAAIDHGAHVINISVVSCVRRDTVVDLSDLHTALDRAENANVVVVSAAGNASSSSCEPGDHVYPAHLDRVLAVSALHSNGLPTQYSLPSPHPMLSASGHVAAALSHEGDVLSQGTHKDRKIVPFEGTSFAAPVVAGTASLLRERYPQATAADIRALLYHSVDPMTGAIDPELAVTQVFPRDSPPSHPSLVTVTQPSQYGTQGRMIAIIMTSLLLMNFTATALLLSRVRP
ncbi:type VII secretion-associated serine protease mycosin [Corynebacterium pseudotuberculosis]|uniref:type VII secretion-associated serine protease mycosin n=1 Tax=Corynebacterium pseudotuberculosis TaxID=1719 RepID=UPI0004D8FD08|nr:type VII secretion-associated serine protease mycosin [Corynebacterium pseudotuberculosis]KEX88844.1 putative subtilisin-like cell wall associated serine protease (mycosin) [Corynebacterium pseudotuberculosis]UTO24867.1 type VII secretion-associated serine protease mycosin [Corynebacterium pseudotuberculosis]